MNKQEIEKKVTACLFEVAPDLEGEEIARDKPIRDQYDFDSIDFLNFVMALHRSFQLEIPESDYTRLQTLNDCVHYLQKTSL